MPAKKKITDPISWNAIDELAKQQLAQSKKMLAAAKKHLREVKKHSKQIDAFIRAFKAQQRIVEANKPKHQFFIEESSATWIGKIIWKWKLKNFLTYRTTGDSAIDTGSVTTEYLDDLNLINTRTN